MLDDKKVFVNEKSFSIIVKELGYKPSNIVIDNHVPINEALVVDVKGLSQQVFGRRRTHI